MNIFYHVSNTELENGSLLTIKYGKAMQEPKFFQSSEHYYAQHLREMIFEEVRKEKFPFVPSRLDSKYLVKDLKAAKAYKKKFKMQYIYEVEVENPEHVLTADMTWIDLSTFQHYDVLKQLAFNYFSGERSENYFLETLYDGKVIVKKVVIEEPVI